MSKARVAVLKAITKELSVTAAAGKYGYSRQHLLHRLLARYRECGLDAIQPRSRRPHWATSTGSLRIEVSGQPDHDRSSSR